MSTEETNKNGLLLPLPPMLSWQEVESGLDGQLPLPSIVERPSHAEKAFLSLARTWAQQYTPLPKNHPPSRDLDLMALSALVLAFDSKENFTDIAHQEIQNNISLCNNHGSIGWMDSILWSLMQVRHKSNLHECSQMDQLVANLNHHNSAIRIWMMEIAWIMRTRLPRDRVLPLLLENVASTLGGVDKAWGLAAVLFEDRAAFLKAANNWSPENDFNDQYAERVEQLKDKTFACQAPFWKLEATIYRQLSQTLCEAPTKV